MPGFAVVDALDIEREKISLHWAGSVSTLMPPSVVLFVVCFVFILTANRIHTIYIYIHIYLFIFIHLFIYLFIYLFSYLFIYGSFLKWGYPKIIHFNVIFLFIKNLPLGGYPGAQVVDTNFPAARLPCLRWDAGQHCDLVLLGAGPRR